MPANYEAYRALLEDRFPSNCREIEIVVDGFDQVKSVLLRSLRACCWPVMPYMTLSQMTTWLRKLWETAIEPQMGTDILGSPALRFAGRVAVPPVYYDRTPPPLWLRISAVISRRHDRPGSIYEVWVLDSLQPRRYAHRSTASVVYCEEEAYTYARDNWSDRLRPSGAARVLRLYPSCEDYPPVWCGLADLWSLRDLSEPRVVWLEGVITDVIVGDRLAAWELQGSPCLDSMRYCVGCGQVDRDLPKQCDVCGAEADSVGPDGVRGIDTLWMGELSPTPPFAMPEQVVAEIAKKKGRPCEHLHRARYLEYQTWAREQLGLDPVRASRRTEPENPGLGRQVLLT